MSQRKARADKLAKPLARLRREEGWKGEKSAEDPAPKVSHDPPPNPPRYPSTKAPKD
jgi:hypothetical protein